MRFLVYSEFTAANIAASMGLPEYSYYFVLRDFLPMLEQLGEVRLVENPAVEVDPLYDEACREGLRCFFLSFSPPQKTPLGLRCPTIPVFAWEFDTIPNEYWLDEQHQDWRYVLEQCGHGITHSGLTRAAVIRELGEDFAITSIPSPVWDKFQTLREKAFAVPLRQKVSIQVRSGLVLDTQALDFEAYMPKPDAIIASTAAARASLSSERAQASTEEQQSRFRITRRYLGEWYLRAFQPLVAQALRRPSHYANSSVQVPAVLETPRLEPHNPVEPASLLKSEMKPLTAEWSLGECNFDLSGVVFCALFNPYDGRKNWVDMLTAFCKAFQDCPDATLIFKLSHHDCQNALNDMLMCLARMPAFRCRVVLLNGFLEKAEFESLLRASAFVVNASHGEGQCLPLMEFLSCGKPAIAPRHSAMLDYIDQDVAFVVDSWLNATAWPHDPRVAYRTLHHQIDWASLVRCYRAAYDCVTQEPERYAHMSVAAIERMRSHCSQAVARSQLEQFLNTEKAHQS